MLKERLLTGAGLACGIIAVLLLSEHVWILKTVAVILSVMAAYELCRAGGYLKHRGYTFGTMAASVFFALMGSPRLAGVILGAALVAAAWLMGQIQVRQTVPE